MSSAWRHRTGGEPHAVPVEMRFVDMFMAALGALIFMAMLMSFLLRFIGETPVEPEPPDAGTSGEEEPYVPVPIQIVTTVLSPATVGEPYELAFAYRGGQQPVEWEIVAGVAEIPDGMTFDAAKGLLTGSPTKTRTSRFVLHVRDGAGDEDQKPFELPVEPPRKGSRRLELIFAGLVLTFFLLAWLATLAAIHEIKNRIEILKKAWAQGQESVTFKSALYREETIFLPGGISEYESNLVITRRISRGLLVVLILLVVWFAWRLWF